MTVTLLKLDYMSSNDGDAKNQGSRKNQKKLDVCKIIYSHWQVFQIENKLLLYITLHGLSSDSTMSILYRPRNFKTCGFETILDWLSSEINNVNSRLRFHFELVPCVVSLPPHFDAPHHPLIHTHITTITPIFE